MSRVQRRLERRSGSDTTAKPARPRVRAGRHIPPAVPAVGGVAALVALIVYLIIQSSSQATGISAAEKAALDDSPDIPGTFVPSQGTKHLSYGWTPSHTPVPYCEGVAWSGATATPTDATPTATATAVSATTPEATATVRTDCYASNPPSSGLMTGMDPRSEVVPGVLMNLPPDPDVYPRDVDIPREAIVHSLEHSALFVGYNCATEDQACWDVVTQLERIGNDRIDNNDNRVVVGRFSDLPVGQIGLSSWTRFDRFPYTEFTKERVVRFISKNACRVDLENFCR